MALVAGHILTVKEVNYTSCLIDIIEWISIVLGSVLILCTTAYIMTEGLS